MKNLLFFIVLCFSSLAWSQTITYSVGPGNGNISGIGFINIANDWQVIASKPVNFPMGGDVIHSITYHPNGKLYATSSGIGWLLSVDTNQFTGGPVVLYLGSFGNWMNATSGGTILFTTNNGGLGRYDMTNDEMYFLDKIGVDGIPYIFHTSMTLINGDLYACAWGTEYPHTKNILKVNLDNPLYSKFIFQMPDTRAVVGMTTFNYDCDSSITYFALPVFNAATILGYDIYQFHEKVPSLTYVTYIPGLKIFDFANPTEYLQFDCTPILDLDEQDLAGTPGLDFKAPKNCINSGQQLLPFTGSNPAILTNTIVDSVWVGIVGGQADGFNEKLGSNGNIASASVNGGIMFYNAVQAANPVFMQELMQAVFYQNEAQVISEGVRKIAVVPYNHDYSGDTAFLSLPVLAGFTASGIITHPSSANTADGSIEISIDGSGYEFLWNNGQTTQNLPGLPPGNYTVTITGENGCSTGLAFTLDVINETRNEKLNPFEACIIPNPSGSAGAVVQLKTPVNGLSWRVFDMTGKIVSQGKSDGKVTSLPKGLPAGLYHVELLDGLQRAHLRWVVGYE